MTTLTTKRLLICGAVGGPLFAAVGLVQAFTRPGFDLGKQSLSLLTLGGAGWVQSANFLLTGGLALAFAAGVRRILHGQPGGTWLPRLLYVYGTGLILGGVSHPDAGDGFPPGTPSHQGVIRTWHGALHMTAGTLAFLALLGSCFVLARYYNRTGQSRWSRASKVAGGVFAICLMGSGAPGGSLILFLGVTTAMIWMAVASQQLVADRAVASVAHEVMSAPQPAHQLT